MRLTTIRTFAATGLAAALALGASQVVAATPSAAPAAMTTPPVTIATDLMDAIGISSYLMTDSEEEAAGDTLITSVQSLLTSATDLLGLNGTGLFPTGFAGVVVNPATSTLNIWWVGGMPTVLSDLINTLVPGINLVTRNADYARSDLISAIEDNRSSMTNVDLAFPKEDGSGIVVTHDPGTTVDGEAIAQMTGVPVTVVETAPFQDAIGGRQADVSNSNGGHYGGAIMLEHGGNGLCSTGFAVLSGINGRLLSAAHCDTTGNERWDNGAGVELTPGNGYVSVALSVDSMFIDPDGGTSGYVYTNGAFSSTKRAVSGTAANNTGDTVTTSGANSGEHKSKVIINDAYKANCNGYSCTLIEACNSTGIAAAEGDSGGPVYHINTDGRAQARGIIKAITTDVAQSTCDASEAYPGNACGHYVLYQPIRPLLSVWNVSIETHS